MDQVRVQCRTVGIAKRWEELADVITHPIRLLCAYTVCDRLLCRGLRHEGPRDFACRDDRAPGNDQRCPHAGPAPARHASQHAPNARLEERHGLTKGRDSERARGPAPPHAQQQLTVRGSRATLRQHAGIAVDLDGQPQPAPLPPEREIPWRHQHNHERRREQRRIADAHMLLLMREQQFTFPLGEL